jgi:hypothetical protein
MYHLEQAHDFITPTGGQIQTINPFHKNLRITTMADTLNNQLVDLLQRAGAAHGVYEHEELNDVYDQEWAAWYANWVIEHGLNTLLNTAYDGAALGKLLRDLNEELKQGNSGEAWAAFTARRLIELNG